MDQWIKELDAKSWFPAFDLGLSHGEKIELTPASCLLTSARIPRHMGIHSCTHTCIHIHTERLTLPYTLTHAEEG